MVITHCQSRLNCFVKSPKLKTVSSDHGWWKVQQTHKRSEGQSLWPHVADDTPIWTWSGYGFKDKFLFLFCFNHPSSGFFWRILLHIICFNHYHETLKCSTTWDQNDIFRKLSRPRKRNLSPPQVFKLTDFLQGPSRQKPIITPASFSGKLRRRGGYMLFKFCPSRPLNLSNVIRLVACYMSRYFTFILFFIVGTCVPGSLLVLHPLLPDTLAKSDAVLFYVTSSIQMFVPQLQQFADKCSFCGLESETTVAQSENNSLCKHAVCNNMYMYHTYVDIFI